MAGVIGAFCKDTLKFQRITDCLDHLRVAGFAILDVKGTAIGRQDKAGQLIDFVSAQVTTPGWHAFMRTRGNYLV